MKPIPRPTSGIKQLTVQTLLEWANQVVSYLQTLEREINTPGPKSIQLEHRKTVVPDAKASVEGMIMWDPVGKRPIVSHDGAWYPVTLGVTPV